MDNPLRNVSSNLAANVIALRRKRGMTQQALAKLARVPRSTLAYVESGAGNPSMKNLVQIASSLQVTLEELLSAPRPACKLVKADRVPRAQKSQGTVTVFQLLPDPVPGMQLERMELKPGALLGGIPHLAGSREYFTCLRGKVEVSVAGESKLVEEGDVLAFPGDEKHAYRSLHSSVSVGISVVVLGSPW